MKIGINGVGRIGRHIFRILSKDNHFKIVTINDINPDPRNILYTIKYDSLYGRFESEIDLNGNDMLLNGQRIKIYNKEDIGDVDWSECDYVIDASGVGKNFQQAHTLHEKYGVKRVFITNSNSHSDFELVIGVNDDKIDRKHKVVSCSICDTTALAPVLKLLDENYSITGGSITTVHPWLNYQNVLDGQSRYQSNPRQTYHNYALGRASSTNIIPKWTTALDATDRVLSGIKEKLMVFSYRTPHAIVGSADLTICLDKLPDLNTVANLLDISEEKQTHNIFKNDFEPLVSSDFISSVFSCHIDRRWLEYKNKTLKLVLWYDNEFGYSNRVIDQVSLYRNLDLEKK